MMLQSGQTAVVGGLSTEADLVTESRVPYLSAIPIVGELFQYTNKDRDHRNLLVFLTPSIVHTSADSERILQAEIKRRKIHMKDQMKAFFQEHNTFEMDETQVGESKPAESGN
jgi:type II secretory pathway component GspD/PulD (secretin)